MELFKKQLIWLSLAVLLAGVPVFAAGADGNGRHGRQEGRGGAPNGIHATQAALLQGHDDHDRHQGGVRRGGERGERHEREEHGRRGYGRNYGVPYYSSPYFGFSYNSPYYYNYSYPAYSPYYGYNSGGSYDIGYNDGLNAGASDRERGFGYNPRRYAVNGDIDYLNGFDAGYAAGYSGGY